MNTNISKTSVNVQRAFEKSAVTSIAYLVYSDLAREEGLTQIATVLNSTAQNKITHCKMYAKMLGRVSSTLENLRTLAALEEDSINNLIPKFIADAHEEGYFDVADKFERMSQVLRSQHQLCSTFESQLHMSVVVKGQASAWKCRVCGNISMDPTVPAVCPVCDEANTYGEMKKEIMNFLTNQG